ncbi:hypothetical protein TCAP_04378 [Tolypocladium capitatum]|uniref:Uncharacterized protein n=1 Tax=Tolypocladium capitatum TaxID=45235 RepID=A0A2K3QDT1_9HYPO|nr:hypothetical protein TCAP_04378 [Tolypocladium capitatum]
MAPEQDATTGTKPGHDAASINALDSKEKVTRGMKHTRWTAAHAPRNIRKSATRRPLRVRAARGEDRAGEAEGGFEEGE